MKLATGDEQGDAGSRPGHKDLPHRGIIPFKRPVTPPGSTAVFVCQYGDLYRGNRYNVDQAEVRGRFGRGGILPVLAASLRTIGRPLFPITYP